MATDHLEGYAWAENVGWIKLGTYTGGGSHIYGNTTATDYGVNLDAAGNLSGYAWGTNIGWINFKPTNGGVTVNQTTGLFDGYAWSENVGWIHFQNASPAYVMRYTVIPTVVLSVSSNTGTEAAATVVTVTATASSAVVGDQTVTLTVTGLNAGDYSLSGTTITLANGQTTGTVTFTIVNDTEVESTETATLTLSNPSAGITLGATTSQMISITDNDTASGTTGNDSGNTGNNSGTSGNTTITTPPLPDYLSLFIQVDGSGQGRVETDTGLSCQSSDCQNNEAGELKCDSQVCNQLEQTTSTVTLTPHANADSVFSNWGGHEDCVDGKVFMNGGKLCIAYFHRIYTLIVATQGPGQVMGYGDSNQPSIIDCGAKCQTSVSDGMQVSLQATPNQGMTFGGWSGDCGNTTQTPLMVEVTKDMKCLASFAAPAPVSKSEDLDSSTKLTTPVVTTPVDTTPPATLPVTVTTETTDNVPTMTPTPSAMSTTSEVSTTPPVETTPATAITTPPVDTTPAPVVTSPVVLTPPVDLTPSTPPPVVAVTPPPVVAPLLVETYYPLVIIPANFNCPTTGNVDEVCNYGGREVTYLNVLGTGIVSNGLLKTTVVNMGWVSNFHITATGKLSGGVVTGYIVNEGLIRDFDFKGMSIIGGTLGGVITNTSRVGGYFQNVTLQANTKITGGILKGTIKGDKNAPALLENVRVKKGSKLSGVKLGKKVKLEKGVVVEK